MLVRQLIARNPGIFFKIYQHPFNQQLSAGTLNRDVFNFYLEQDAMYLGYFGEALRILSGRFTDRHYVAQFKYFAEDMIAAERDIHSIYLGRTKPKTLFSPQKPYPIQKISVIKNYTNHLLYTAENGSIAEAVLSCVPCFVIYQALGEQMSDGKQQNNPYSAWIASYAGKQFVTSTQQIVQTADQLTAIISCPVQRAKACTSFLQSAQFELMFFDAAYIGRSSYLPEYKYDSISCKNL